MSKELGTRNFLVFGLGVLAMVCALTATQKIFFAHAASSVIINEIAWMGTTASVNDEWIELHNPTDADISLEGWTLAAVDATPSVHLSGIVPANGFYLLERTSDETVPGALANLLYTGALSNSGETLVLKNEQSVEIDRVNGSDSWKINGVAAGNNDTKETAQRMDSSWVTAAPTPKAQNKTEPVAVSTNTNATTNATTNANSASAVNTNAPSNNTSSSATETSAVSTNTNSPSTNSSSSAQSTVSADDFSGIRLNELLPDPAGDDAGGEWVELYNSAEESVDLAGGTLSDTSGKKYTFPKNTVLDAGAYKAFDRKITGLILNNDTDTVLLKDVSGKVIDQVTYKDGSEGQSYARNGNTWEWTDPSLEKKNTFAATTSSSSKTNVNTGAAVKSKVSGITINEAKNASSRSIVTVAGVVSSVLGEIADNTLYILDATGGLAVVVKSPNAPKFSRGDSVIVKGKMSTSQGEKRLVVDDGKNITVGPFDKEPEAWPMTVQDISPESLGLLVSVQGKVTDRTKQGFVLDDDTGFLPVSFSSVEGSLSDEDATTARGILVKTSKGISLVPRDQNDLLSGKVLGDEEAAAQNLSTSGKNRDTINQLLIILIAVCVGGAIAYWYLQRTSAYETSSTETSEESDKDQR